MGAFTVTATITQFSGAPLTIKVTAVTAVTEDGGTVTGQVAFGVPATVLTPQGSGSAVITGLYNGSDTTVFTPAAGNAFLDSAVAGSFAYAAGYYSGTVTGGTPLTAGASAPGAQWEAIAAIELPAAGTPAISASTPDAATVAGSRAVTPAFLPPSGAVLVAMLLFEAAGPSVTTITDTSGLGMAWTQRASYQIPYQGAVVIYTTTVPQVLANDPGALAASCVI